MRDIALITCDCPANTGKLASAAGRNFVLKNPALVDECMSFRDMKNMKFLDKPAILVLQGCEKNCPILRLEKETGRKPNTILHLATLGFVREGTADPSYAEIEQVTTALKSAVKEL